MNRPPAFQFYPKDWLDFKVQRMSLAAQGVYIKLLCYMWNDSKDQCSILDDNELLARAIGTTVEHWVELRKEIQFAHEHAHEPLFEEKSGRLVSVRLHKEAQKQRKYRTQQAIKGKRSAQQRLNHGLTTVEPEYQPEGKSSVFNLRSSELKNKRAPVCQRAELNGHQSGFDIFWHAYPRKRNKGRAEQAWVKLQPDEVLLGLMLGKLDQAKHTPQWKKDNGEFIPHPATWLNAKGWQDEYTPAPKERMPL